MLRKMSLVSLFDMCCMAIFAAVIAVLAQISIPMAGGIPVTMQTLAVALSGVVLGKKRGAVSCLIYLLLGAIGLPVFAGAHAGPGSVFGPAGGFLISFPLLSFFAGLGTELSQRKEKIISGSVIAMGLIAGAAVNYAVGTFWYSAVTGNSLKAGLAVCVAPFIINDVIKLAVAGWAGLILRNALKRAGVLTKSEER